MTHLLETPLARPNEERGCESHRRQLCVRPVNFVSVSNIPMFARRVDTATVSA